MESTYFIVTPVSRKKSGTRSIELKSEGSEAEIFGFANLKDTRAVEAAELETKLGIACPATAARLRAQVRAVMRMEEGSK